MEVKRHRFVQPSELIDTEDDTLEVVPVEIAAGSLNEIAGLLNNLYQDGPLAMFREYLTNAADSMRMAGTFNTRPIEVTIGDANIPFVNWKGETKATRSSSSRYSREWSHTIFEVKDYGLGMSLDALKNVYSKYGASTKKGNIAVVGEFGVGAKSALSLTPYFEVISVKNHEKVTATIERDTTTNISAMLMKRVEKTGDPDSFTVRIPVEQTHIFNLKNVADKFFYSWPNNSVLVNGKPPVGLGLFDNADRYITIPGIDGEPVGWVRPLSERHYQLSRYDRGFTKANQASPSLLAEIPTIFVGGVPYDDGGTKEVINQTQYSKLGYSIHLNIPNGMLTLTPNREGIKFTDDNKRVIQAHLDDLLNLLPQVFTEKFNSLSYEDAMKFRNWNAYPLNTELLVSEQGHREERQSWDSHELPEYYYHGELMPTKLNLKETFPDVKVELINTTKWRSLPELSYPEEINLINFGSARVPYSSRYSHNITVPRNRDYYVSYPDPFTPFTVILHGVYKGKAKSPIKSFLANAVTQLGLDIKPGGFMVLNIPTDAPLPVELSSTVLTLTYDQMVELNSDYRKENYKPREKKPVSDVKTVENSPYASFYTDPVTLDTTVQLWQRDEIKKFDEPAVWVEEAEISAPSSYLLVDKLIKTFNTVDPQPVMHGLMPYKTISKGLVGTHLFISPKIRSSLVFEKNDKIKLLADEITVQWDNFDEAKKLKIAYMYELKYDYSGGFHSLKSEKLVDQVTNKYTQACWKELEEETEDALFAGLLSVATKDNTYKERVELIKDYTKYNRKLNMPPVELWNKMVELVPFLN